MDSIIEKKGYLKLYFILFVIFFILLILFCGIELHMLPFEQKETIPFKVSIFFNYLKDIVLGIFSGLIVTVLVAYYDYSKQIFRNLFSYMKSINYIYEIGVSSCNEKSVTALRQQIQAYNNEFQWIYTYSKRTKKNSDLIDTLSKLKMEISDLNEECNVIFNTEEIYKLDTELLRNKQLKLTEFLIDTQKKMKNSKVVRDKNKIILEKKQEQIEKIRKKIQLDQELVDEKYEVLLKSIENLRKTNEKLFSIINVMNKRIII